MHGSILRSCRLHHLSGLVSSTLICGSLIAQPVEGADDDIYLYGAIKDQATGTRLADASVLVCVGYFPIVLLEADSLGRYEMYLDFDHAFQVFYSAPGRVGKLVEVDTRNIPEEERTGGFGMNVDMTLFEARKDVDLGFLRDPIGKARYVVDDAEIAWDLDYTQRVRDRIVFAQEHPGKVQAGIPAPAVDRSTEEVEQTGWSLWGTLGGGVAALVLMAWIIIRRIDRGPGHHRRG